MLEAVSIGRHKPEAKASTVKKQSMMFTQRTKICMEYVCMGAMMMS